MDRKKKTQAKNPAASGLSPKMAPESGLYFRGSKYDPPASKEVDDINKKYGKYS